MTARPDVLNAAEPVRIGLGADAITLVEGATFCRSDRWGDILVGRPHGRFFRDAGVLSRWHHRPRCGRPGRHRAVAEPRRSSAADRSPVRSRN